jgi:hypothetical protein
MSDLPKRIHTKTKIVITKSYDIAKRRTSTPVRAFNKKNQGFVSRNRGKIAAAAAIGALAILGFAGPIAYSKLSIDKYKKNVDDFANEIIRISKEQRDNYSGARAARDLKELEANQERARVLQEQQQETLRRSLLAKQELELAQKKLEDQRALDEINANLAKLEEQKRQSDREEAAKLEQQRILQEQEKEKSIQEAKRQEEILVRQQQEQRRAEEARQFQEQQRKERETAEMYKIQEERIRQEQLVIQQRELLVQEKNTKKALKFKEASNPQDCSPVEEARLEREFRKRSQNLISYLRKIEQCKDRTVLSIIDDDGQRIPCENSAKMKSDYLDGNNIIRTHINNCKTKKLRDGNAAYFNNIKNAKAKVDSGI